MGSPTWSRRTGITRSGSRLGRPCCAQAELTEAEVAFQAALHRAPNSGWALFGLREAAKARGDGAATQDAEARLTEVWVGDRSLLELKRL